MALEIVECVLSISRKIYETVDEVQANKKRSQRLADRIRCLVTPLNDLLRQNNRSVVYKEVLIDLVKTLEESRQFLSTFTEEKTAFRKLQDVCYANKVKDNFEYLNEKLNTLVPTLSLGLQVEYRKTVRKSFSLSTRYPEDTRDESRDLKDIHQMTNLLGLPSFLSIPCSDIEEIIPHSETAFYSFCTAKYRKMPVVLKRPKFNMSNERKEALLKDARNALRFNSENVVRTYGVCVEAESYLIVQEYMERGDLHQALQTSSSIPMSMLLRICLETSRGLYFIHCSEVIHRNTSSSIYLVNADWHVKISGFESSVAQYFNEKKRKQEFCSHPSGTLSFNINSQYFDIFCYGFVLCEILTYPSLKQHRHNIDTSSLCNDECISALNGLHHQNDIVDVAKLCLSRDEESRPLMEEVVRRITSVYEDEDL